MTIRPQTESIRERERGRQRETERETETETKTETETERENSNSKTSIPKDISVRSRERQTDRRSWVQFQLSLKKCAATNSISLTQSRGDPVRLTGLRQNPINDRFVAAENVHMAGCNRQTI